MRTSAARVALLATAGLALATTLTACSSVPTAEVGDCSNVADLQGEEISEFTIVDCDEPHDAEFYYKTDVEHEEYPGDTAMTEEAEQICYDSFEGYVGVPFEESELQYGYFHPIQESWDRADDREVLCVAYLVGETTTESFENSGR